MVARSDQHKEVLNERTDKAMERYGFLSDEFQKAGDQTQEKDRGEPLREMGGSEMVRKDNPHPQPRPPAEIARPVDREAFIERWQQEIERAKDQERGDDRER